jgi:hypothetical protein
MSGVAGFYRRGLRAFPSACITRSPAGSRLAASLTITFCVLIASPVHAATVPGCVAESLEVPAGLPLAGIAAVAAAPEVRVLYFVPSDLSPDPSQQDRILQASNDAHRWYADHTDIGQTFLWAGAVEVVLGQRQASYYQADLWGTVLGELGARGYPIWSPGSVFAIWVKGGGLFAGGTTWFGWTGNAMVGVEAFIQDGCMPTHPSNWPCTPGGAMAHELGHAFGMPHPDTAGTWFGDYINDNSLMGSHWNFPERDPRNYVPDSPWGLLNYERDHLRYNPVLDQQTSLYPAIPNDPKQRPALPNPPLRMDAFMLGSTTTQITWNDDGAFRYYSYWSTVPDFATYAPIGGSPTTALSLVHIDSGQPILYF